MLKDFAMYAWTQICHNHSKAYLFHASPLKQWGQLLVAREVEMFHLPPSTSINVHMWDDVKRLPQWLLVESCLLLDNVGWSARTRTSWSVMQYEDLRNAPIHLCIPDFIWIHIQVVASNNYQSLCRKLVTNIKIPSVKYKWGYSIAT